MYKQIYKQRYRKRSLGVPIGYKENWAYHGHWGEQKIAPRTWKFRFRATKRRRANTYGGFGKGTTGTWKIIGYQRIRKIGKGMYQTDLIGVKKSMGFNVKKPYRRY